MNELNVVELPYIEFLSRIKEIELNFPMVVHGNTNDLTVDTLKGWEGAALYHLRVDGAFNDLWVIIKPKYRFESFRTDWALFTARKYDVEIGISSLTLKMLGSMGLRSTFSIDKSISFNGDNTFDKVILGINFIKEAYRIYNEKTKLTPEEEDNKLDRMVLRELRVIKEFQDSFGSYMAGSELSIPREAGELFSAYIDKEGFINANFPSYYRMDIKQKGSEVFVVLPPFNYRKVFDTFDPEAIIEFVKESRVRVLTDPKMVGYRERCDEVVLSRSKDNSGEGTIKSTGKMTDDEVMSVLGKGNK